MTPRDHMDTIMARQVERTLARLVEQDAGTGSSPATGRDSLSQQPSRTRQAIASAAVAIVVIGASGLAIHGLAGRPATGAGRPSPTSSAPPAVITVKGETIPYAGLVPWSSAIESPSDPRRITLYADGDGIKGPILVCGLPTERVFVIETGATVAITVAGYSKPLPWGVGCAGVGHSLQPLTVRLAEPIRSRTLTDTATGRVHAVLNPTEVPEPGHLPPGFVPADYQPISRDDTGVVVRQWTTGSDRDRTDEVITLTISTAGTAPTLRGSRLPPIDVNGTTARVTGDDDVYNWDRDIQWTTGRTTLTLHYRAWPKHHVGLDQLEATARSITP